MSTMARTVLWIAGLAGVLQVFWALPTAQRLDGAREKFIDVSQRLSLESGLEQTNGMWRGAQLATLEDRRFSDALERLRGQFQFRPAVREKLVAPFVFHEFFRESESLRAWLSGPEVSESFGVDFDIGDALRFVDGETAAEAWGRLESLWITLRLASHCGLDTVLELESGPAQEWAPDSSIIAYPVTVTFDATWARAARFLNLVGLDSEALDPETRSAIGVAKPAMILDRLMARRIDAEEDRQRVVARVFGLWVREEAAP